MANASPIEELKRIRHAVQDLPVVTDPVSANRAVQDLARSVSRLVSVLIDEVRDRRQQERNGGTFQPQR